VGARKLIEKFTGVYMQLPIFAQPLGRREPNTKVTGKFVPTRRFGGVERTWQSTGRVTEPREDV
tara:strand:- start:1229 stop:1420 length:192 start_codon:yes stop_codon:yes gene_type:complete